MRAIPIPDFFLETVWGEPVPRRVLIQLANRTGSFASGLAPAPHGVAVDAGGNVYVATTVVTEYPFGGGSPIPIGTGYNNGGSVESPFLVPQLCLVDYRLASLIAD